MVGVVRVVRVVKVIVISDGGLVVRVVSGGLDPGAYTRPLFSSTSAVSDTQKHPTHHEHPLKPPQHGLHNLYAQPLSRKKRSS
jgi:hypothetical protein